MSAAPKTSDLTTTGTAEVGQAPERRVFSSSTTTMYSSLAASLEQAGSAEAERLHRQVTLVSLEKATDEGGGSMKRVGRPTANPAALQEMQSRLWNRLTGGARRR